MSGATAAPAAEAVLVRHAETEWSREGRHTGRTDIPLTAHGRETAALLARRLGGWRFDLVLRSPARRAAETCELCGLGPYAQEREALWEWDYGEYEGLTTAQIHEVRPGWVLWRDGCPGGESPAEVGARADLVIAEVREHGGIVAIFSHGHLLRVLGARWIGLEAAAGGHLALSTGTISTLGYERDWPVLNLWNG